MTRARLVALLCLALSFSAFGQSVSWSTGVVYEYDGSGSVKKIGTDTYIHDTAQRLIRGSVAGSQQSYTYDSFGNRKACQSAASGDCQYGFGVDSTTNRIEGRAYDKRGNMLQLPEGNTLEYDELGMVRKENGDGRQVYYIYTADDERIAVYEADTKLNTHRWEWTVRGLDRKPLREFTSEGSSGTASFRWAKDNIWRDSVLLASRQADAGAPGGVSTYHYHVDHLGTPRQVTNSGSVIIGRHDYLPFGPELTSTRIDESKLQDLKFTGHERDEARDRPPLDYMHARYYEPRLGRFLSVDPTWDSAELSKPQSWNRYSYVRNDPVNMTDPDGRCGSPCVMVLNRAQVYAATHPEQINRWVNAAGALFGVAQVDAGGLGTALATDTAGVDSIYGDVDGEIVIDGDEYPEAAQHIDEAQAAGHPAVITLDRAGAKDRRRESTGSTSPQSDKDRDEYPPAVAEEGGKGASVRHIDPRDNRGAGASMGNQMRKFTDGAKLLIKPPGIQFSDAYLCRKLLELSSVPLCQSAPHDHDQYSGKRFEELLRLCERRNGFFAFESALHVFPIGRRCETISFQEWNAPATWKAAYGGLVDHIWFFAEDIFGDQFGVHDESVILFRSESGEIEPVASTVEEWACQILIDADNLTGYQLAHRWQLANGPIASDTRLAGKIPFVLGGAYDLSNVYAGDRIRTMQLRGDIYRQTRDLPDGTRVNLRVD